MFFACCPAHVSAKIAFSMVYSVNTMFWTWCISNLFIKLFKRIPQLWAHCDTFCTVFLKCFCVWVKTPFLNVSPCLVYFCVSLTVGVQWMITANLVMPTFADFDLTFIKSIQVGFPYTTARAVTNTLSCIHSGVLRLLPDTCNCQVTVSIANFKINFSRYFLL